MCAHKGRTKKLKRHGLHGFALDQPSINGIGPINRSEKMKRSETVGNGRKHDQAKTCPSRIAKTWQTLQFPSFAAITGARWKFFLVQPASLSVCLLASFCTFRKAAQVPEAWRA